MSWLIVGIRAFQHDRCPGRLPAAAEKTRISQVPDRSRNAGDEKARHDSGEPPAVKRGLLRGASVWCAPVKRQLTLLDCVGIGVNGIIGSGIFLLPARVFAASGGLAWASWFAVG